MKKDEIERLEREVAELTEIRRRQALGESTPEDETRMARINLDTRLQFAGAAVALAVLVLGLGWWLAGAGDREARREAAAERREARANSPEARLRASVYACQHFVKDQLRDPDSARFLSGAPERVNQYLFHVTGTLVARNALGGMIDQPYRCELVIDGPNWRSKAIRIGD